MGFLAIEPEHLESSYETTNKNKKTIQKKTSLSKKSKSKTKEATWRFS